MRHYLIVYLKYKGLIIFLMIYINWFLKTRNSKDELLNNAFEIYEINVL